ncbi:uncharacterized protein [Macrobrachium rosenbergii]|uniref:uncharacterized protein isoform X12 n=1 Tax=Macrobrachium rosenbergii TaxID=79674 RepID=UPI0034D5086F
MAVSVDVQRPCPSLHSLTITEPCGNEPFTRIVQSPSNEGLSVMFFSGTPPPDDSYRYPDDGRPEKFANKCQYFADPSASGGQAVINKCVISVSSPNRSAVPDGGQSLWRLEARDVRGGRNDVFGQGRCVIPVVSEKEISDYTEKISSESIGGDNWGRRGRGSHQGRVKEEISAKFPASNVPSNQALSTEEPSARIVLKGSIAFTHDGGSSEDILKVTSTGCSIGRTQSLITISNGGRWDDASKSSTGTVRSASEERMPRPSSSTCSYVESYLPEAPPRRRRSRTRVSSDSSTYIPGELHEGDDLSRTSATSNVFQLSSGNSSLRRFPEAVDIETSADAGDSTRSTSLIITLGGGQDDLIEGSLLLVSDQHDTEDDNVFPDGKEPGPSFSSSTSSSFHSSSFHGRRSNSSPPVLRSASSLSERRSSSNDYAQDTIIVPSNQVTRPVEDKYSSPVRSNVSSSGHKTKKETKRKESNNRGSGRTSDKDGPKNSNGKLDPSNEPQMVNIEFITRGFYEGRRSEKATHPAPPPTPPPRTKSLPKGRARSTSPLKTSTPKDSINPRRSRSCCFHFREPSPPRPPPPRNYRREEDTPRGRGRGTRRREEEEEDEGAEEEDEGGHPSLLDSFFEQGMVGDDLCSLPWDFKLCPLYQNMSALQLAAEGRDYLMWCPDQEFDNAVSALDIRGLVELVQTLQDAMAVEQQTFDSLTQQLELVQDPLQQQRLSAALCTSQTRLARLCSRNMRCFTQQALKARQRDGSESRSSSPRDSGLVVSSAGASDAEGDPRSPTGASFKHSLAFFQRAAHLMANNTRNCSLGARQKEARRRSSRGSSCYGSSSSEAWSVASDDPAADHYAGKVMGGDLVYEDDLVNLEDQGTYEQVLFINGRPQYQDDISSTSTTTCGADRSRSGSWTRVRVDGSTGVGSAAGRASDSQLPSVSYSNSSLPRRGTANASTDTAAVAAEAQTQTLAADLNSYVTLPRRKPYLNFKSVACGSNSSSSSNHSNLSYINSASADFDNEDLRYFKERVGILKNNGVSTITRTQSFKEGLNSCSHEFGDQHNNPAYGLSRTQSFNDGLAGDFNDLESAKPKLQRVPSVDEILESVKTLRAKKTMVKSSPDLLSAQEPVYHSASLPRHKSSKGKAPRPSGTSALLGVRYNGTPSGDNVYERVPEPDYEQIPDAGGRFYENVCRGNNHYENIHLKGEVIYDSPRPTSEQHHHLHHHQHHPHHLYDKVHSDLHYENVKFDTPLYENIDEKEPTYMNVVGSKTNVYANLDAPANKKSSSSGSIKSSKSKSNKVTISGNSMMQGTTYDVPRAATHIYDSPQKQVRSVASSSSSSEYDTPKNNRSVLPQSTQIVLKAKSEQKQKIDDIFADCDKDSLEGDRDRAPDIPSPDYGSEEEGDGYEDASNDYVSSEFPDEGLGESDTRSYYTEDPAGLEVILEEPEDDYCSSHVSEDDLQREVDITYGLKGERRSLDGSEGIGSAEGDSHSSGGSEHYGEEDCASSGIHSEDTPSPGPPVDHEKEENQQDSNNKSQKRGEDDTRVQQDRCVEVYPETVRQRQRNMMTSANKVDIKNWTSSGNDTLTSPSKVKKFLPSVKALRNQFETGKTNNNRAETNGNGTTNGNLSRKSSISNSSVASSIEKTSSTNSLNSANGSVENLHSSNIENSRPVDPDEPVEPIYSQFKKVDEELRELMSKPPSTTGWNPRPLLKRLYYVPDAPKHHSQGTTYINIEGYLEKLPSGRKKATFWNAWKRRYFVAKDGVLYYYQNPQADKASMKMTLMGGKVECMEPSMVGVDDGKGHYVVVRCSSKQEAERWRRALETHTVEDFASQYVQPWPIPTNPTMLRDTLIIDLGSCSVRAGVLASQATLPQVFFPSVVATERESRRQIWGFDALSPDVRSVSSVSFPVRPSHKISKYSVDLSAVSSLLQKAFADLKVDPKNYNIQLSVPRVLNPNTQAELLRLLFDKYGVKSVNLTHQSILALYAYNATSGIVVDIGDRLDIVPVIDGYIVDGGVSRVPYGGYRILDHLRQFLYMRNVSLINEVESYIIRQVLENICYCAHHYNTEKARCTNNPDNYEKGVSLAEYFQKDCPYEFISLDFGRFQATEGLFNPDAWGLDHPGIHKLVHKAIMECSMDIRKEMSRSIFLAGGVTQLPGLVERLTTEIDNLTPPAIRPKVHASPYRYHAAYIGACVLAESPAFTQSKITREDWNKHGNAALKKWSL